MTATKYTAVPQRECITTPNNDAEPQCKGRKRLSLTATVLQFALVVSIGLNIFFFYHVQRCTVCMSSQGLPSKYAGLHRNITTKVNPQTDYDSLNRTAQDNAWNDKRLEPWTNFVALDEQYTKNQNLPHSQRWPWDLNKGVYIVTSAHELHCVRALRVYINEKQDKIPDTDLTWHYEHMLHCLNVIRESIMCNADDTPLYTGHLHGNIHASHPTAGTGTTKLCRDWDTLLNWSQAHSACYVPVNNISEIERYKFCPDGAKPWEQPTVSS